MLSILLGDVDLMLNKITIIIFSAHNLHNTHIADNYTDCDYSTYPQKYPNMCLLENKKRANSLNELALMPITV